jgi:hypothetical protein
MARIESPTKSGVTVSVEVDPSETPAQAAQRLFAAVDEAGGPVEPPPVDPKARELTLMEQWVCSLARDHQGSSADRTLVYMQIGICQRRRQRQVEAKLGMDERLALEQLREEQHIAPKFITVQGQQHRAMFYDVNHGIDRIARAAVMASVVSIASARGRCPASC